MSVNSEGTISINVAGHELVCSEFRVLDLFETFTEYTVRHLSWYYELHTEATNVHCIISGFPIYSVVKSEMENLITQASIDLGLKEFDNPLSAPTTEQIEQAFNEVVEYIADVLLLRSTRAPSLTFSMHRLALANAPAKQQLVVLLATLLYDAGELRGRAEFVNDKLERIVATVALADEIRAIEDESVYSELFAALVELDAKYAIRQLVFTNAERVRLNNLLAKPEYNFAALNAFVLSLLAFRDQHSEIIEGGEVWTRTVFARQNFEAVDRLAHSNLWRPAEEKKRVVNVGGEVKKSTRGRKPKKDEEMTREQLARRDRREANKRIADIFLNMMDTK